MLLLSTYLIIQALYFLPAQLLYYNAARCTGSKDTQTKKSKTFGKERMKAMGHVPN